MAYQHPAMQAQQAPQGFSGAIPRVVPQKTQLYRDPYGFVGKDGNMAEYQPTNIAFDKRVFRGSTNAAMVIPAGSYPDQLFRATGPIKRSAQGSRMGSRGGTRQGLNSQAQQRAQRAEEFFSRDVNTPEPTGGRANIDVQTDQFVTELTDKAPSFQIGVQTDFGVQGVQPNWKQPILQGNSRKTLVEDNELFVFNDAVEPILSVLLGKTLEESQMEVLEEEELKTMAQAGQQFSKLIHLEGMEIKDMEDAEKKLIKQHEAKKNAKIEKKDALVSTHKKLCCNKVVKQYLTNLRVSSFTTLKDMSVFTTPKDIMLQTRLMPWLIDGAIESVNEEEEFSNLPFQIAEDSNMVNAKDHHVSVSSYNEKIATRRADEKQAEEDKIKAKEQRAIDRALNRKIKGFAKLKDWIKTNSIDQGTVQDGILNGQSILDIDSGEIPDSKEIQVLGGYLGQFIIVMNSIVTYLQTHGGTPSKGSAANSRLASPLTSQRKENDDDADKEKADEPAFGHPALHPKVIQGFLHSYIQEKMKCEKFPVQVSYEYAQFLKNLAKPMEVNEMRTMKGDNYVNLRNLISKKVGGQGLQWMNDFQEQIGLQEGVFGLVFESFWDLYMFKPQVEGVYPKQLLEWIKKVKLVALPEPEQKAVEENDDEASQKQSAREIVKDKFDAIVSVMIAKKLPEAEEDENGNVIEKSYNEDNLEEQEINDKCIMVQNFWSTQGADKDAPKKIAIFNQAVGRVLRKDLLEALLNSNEHFFKIDVSELETMIEADYAKIEKNLFTMFNEGQILGEIPVFNFKPNTNL